MPSRALCKSLSSLLFLDGGADHLAVAAAGAWDHPTDATAAMTLQHNEAGRLTPGPMTRTWWHRLLAPGEPGRPRRKTFRLTAQEKKACAELRRHGLFDADWYLEHYRDIAEADIDPLHHLVRHGIFEGRSPNRDILERALSGFVPSVSPERNTDLARYLEVVALLDRGDVTAVPSAVHVEMPMVDKGHLGQFSDANVLRGLARFARFPLFSEGDYLALNRPLMREPGLVAHRHAFLFGFSEGRTVFDRQTIANELGRRCRIEPSNEVVANGPEPRTRRLSISVVYNTCGNSFLHDIALNLVHDLRTEGHDAALIDDRGSPSDLREHTIIMAPHEFFFVGQGPKWIRDDVTSRSVMFNTEQPQTIWFDRAVPFNMLARGVIDMSPQVASMYAESTPTIHCDLSGPALEDVLPDDNDPLYRILPKAARTIGSRDSGFDDRSLDVSFFGGISAHRDRFFSQTARFFADYKTLFYCRRSELPIGTGGPDLLAAARHAAFHSKVVLNIHRDEFGFFEWHRIVRLGIEAGAIVVSEPCLPHPDFKPNVHYFEESGRHIQNVVEWLVRSPDGRAEADRMRRAALDLVNAKRRQKHAGRRIAHFLDSLGGNVP